MPAAEVSEDAPLIRRESVFKENQLAARLEIQLNPSNRFDDAWNCAPASDRCES